ncbi:NAD-dependent protein deacylase [Roseovarius litorisediminis]|uniref:NAD-dependent protein deacylase n=2 Tax=Roseovarius litorisediminis TaxID=1312363 RepID=A0A1Y5TAA1_9RHOB|nr:NAD-dependent protein deacylase [Roseovarius litorisediminis]
MNWVRITKHWKIPAIGSIYFSTLAPKLSFDFIRKIQRNYGMKKIVILTGAGISAESGLGTFRDEGGLWAKHRIEDVATPEAFARDPALVHRFYNTRRAQAVQAQPNAAHLALARLEAGFDGDVLIITQNVDDLHDRAGSRNVVQMHGALTGALCQVCGFRWKAPMEMRPSDTCPACKKQTTRPDIVWFGEVPYGMSVIDPALASADIFASIGTSGQVYPAAAYAQHARRMGARTVELNLEPSANARDFDQRFLGPASEIVPRWVDDLLTA